MVGQHFPSRASRTLVDQCVVSGGDSLLNVLLAAPRFGKNANERSAHSHSWPCLLSQHGLRSCRYMELGLAPRRKKPRLGHRAWFCPPCGGTVFARPSPAQPALYLGGAAGLVGSLEGPHPHEGARSPPSLPL